MAWLRVVPRAVAFTACAGAVIGLWGAGLEISANRYVAQGLWRTVLWLGADSAFIGALVGSSVGLLLAITLAPRQPPATGPADGAAGAGSPKGSGSQGVVERRLALALMLTAALTLAVLLLPAGAPEILGYPSSGVFGLGVGLFWAVAAAFLLARTSEATRPVESVEGVWTIVVWLGYLVVLSHVWARLEPGVMMAGLACGGLLVAVLVYSALHRPVQFLARVVGGRVQRSVALGRVHRLSTVVLGVVVVLWTGAGAVALQARGRLKQFHPNLLIIAVDTLREDHVSLLSKPTSGWDLTPNLRERLAPHGTYFTRAHSQAPWTMPSFASVFTGLYPEEHGAQVGDGRLLPHQLTLAEILRDCGYRTLAVVSGNFVSSEVGMLQGFDLTDESQVSDRESVTSVEVTDRALRLLEARRDEPFFLFAHYFDPHWKYQKHEGFHFAERGLELNLPEKLNVIGNPETYFSPRELAQLKALYAEEIGATDQSIGRLLAYLDEHRLWESTCVVFVSDHGDEFLDHGGFEHGHTVFEELVHVPLLVADPSRRAPAVVTEVVEARWLFGTILDMLGVGRSVRHVATENVFSPPPRGERYARSSVYGEQSCLIGNRYKLIEGEGRRRQTLPTASSGPRRDGRRRPRAGSRTREKGMLFDLRQDPLESRNLSAELPEVSHHLRSTLAALNEELARRSDTTPMPRLDPDQERKLKALGYL